MRYRLDLNENQEIAASLQKCSDALKFNLAVLPIFISHDAEGYPAYITPDGIWVHEKVVLNDPTNFHVYLAHEIFHWVVNNYSILNKFTPVMVNYITDFKINELLYKLFGFNVRKVKYKGLLNKKWFGKSLNEIGLAIIREDWIEEVTCSAEGVPHPKIGECAAMLRRRYKEHLEATQEVFHFTVDEERAFTDALEVIDRSKLTFTTFALDKYVLLKALWYCFWHKQPFAMRPEGVLPPEHQLIFSVRWPQGMDTVGRDIDAMWAAMRMMQALDNDAGFLWNQRHRANDRCTATRSKLTIATKSRIRRKLLKQLKKHNASYEKWNKAKSLTELMKEDPIRLKAGMETRTRPRTMFSSMTETTDVLLPAVRGNDAVKRIRMLTRKPMRSILATVDMIDEVQDIMGDMFTNAQEGKDIEVPDTLEDAEALQKEMEQEMDSQDDDGPPNLGAPESQDEAEARKKVNEALKEDGDDEEGDDEEESVEDSSTEKGSSNADSEGKSKSEDTTGDTGTPNGGLSNASESGKESEIDGFGLSVSAQVGGSGAGKEGAQFAKRRVKVLDSMSAQRGSIARILSYMAEAETLIKQIQKQKTKLGEEGPDATYEFGNNLSNMTPEEVAFLNGENTKMAFLVKYATHQLLQRAPLESRKQPVVLMLDQSGSMFAGRMYEIAAGFCLAVLKFMIKDKRGVSFTVFDSSNGREVHADVNQKIDIMKILRILTTPSQGGTNFQLAFERAQTIRDYFKWKSFNGMCITDGLDRFSNPGKILSNMKEKDKFIGVLVGRDPGDTLSVVCDEVRHVHDRSLVDLVNAAKSIF